MALRFIRFCSEFSNNSGIRLWQGRKFEWIYRVIVVHRYCHSSCISAETVFNCFVFFIADCWHPPSKVCNVIIYLHFLFMRWTEFIDCNTNTDELLVNKYSLKTNNYQFCWINNFQSLKFHLFLAHVDSSSKNIWWTTSKYKQ